MIRYIFATQRERIEFGKVADMAPRGEISVLGDGIPSGKEDVWVHIGYCKGDGVGVGALIEPSCVCKGKEVIRIDSLFPIERRVCITGEPQIKVFPAVFDDDLFRIAEMPHKKLYAIKIVSRGIDDSVNHGKDGAWIRVAELLLNYLRE